jgi:sucrose phosphorylase
MTLEQRITEHLSCLYGIQPARHLAPALVQMVEQTRPHLPPRPYRPLTNSDVMLITYADQVLDPEQPPLQVLGSFLQRHAASDVRAVHILPFYPWTSDDGFAVVDYRAVDPRYGSWQDIERLGSRFDLMLDLVCNHTSSQCPWFQRFLQDDPQYRDFYITVEGSPDLSRVIRPRTTPLLTEFPGVAGPRKVWTTFSADQVDLNYRNPAVLRTMLEILLEYVRHGARFIRLDAVAFLWKEIGTSCLHLPQTHRIVQLMRTILDHVTPDVRLVTETNVPHAENVSYFGDGTNEAHLVYNFALPPLVLHSFLTGQARELTRWAAQLRTPSPHTAFLNYLASHDGIGLNPVRGILQDHHIEALVRHTRAAGGFVSEKALPDGSRAPYELNINYLDALSPPEAAEPPGIVARKFATAHAIALSLAGMPAIYFHSLFGSRGDRAAALATGIYRRINREKLDLSRLETELADPSSLRAQVHTALRRWLALRRSHPAFAPAAPQIVHESDPRLFVIERQDPRSGQSVLCIHNLSGDAAVYAVPGPVRGCELTWHDATTGRSIPNRELNGTLRLEPWQTWWGLPPQEPSL